MKFALITYILHHKHKGKYYSYEPYIREMNIWLKFTTGFICLAPKKNDIPKATETAYFRSPSEFYEIPQTSLISIKESLRSIFYFPLVTIKIFNVMKNADHIHLRCPGNVGLLSCFVQIFFPHKPKTAKYAGNWDPKAKQPWSYKLQKRILSNTFLTRNMTVLIYGKWPNQSKNIHPFFTASFSENEIKQIEKNLNSPYKFLFVGNLVPGKQPQFAIRLVEALKYKNISAELHVYGDGILKNELKIHAENKDYIHLHGNQPIEVLKQAYKDSHFLILASKSEGWPKAVAEAMFFGCIPIVTPLSCVPWMLKYGSRGILIPEVKVVRGQRTEGRGEVVSGEYKEDSRDVLKGVGRGRRSEDRGEGERGLLGTFQKNRQFECFPNAAEAVSENVSRTGFSETPAYRQGRLEVTSGKMNEDQDVLGETVDKIIKLLQDPVEMKRMSMEAQEWSQEYTLEKFEEAIKDILKR